MKLVRFVCMALALMALLSLPALAAPEDRDFVRKTGIFEELSDNPRGGCAAGDALYLYGDNHIFSYRVGDEALTVAKFTLPENGENEIRELVRLFADGDALCALLCVSRSDANGSIPIRLEIAEVTLDGGEARFGEATEAGIGELIMSYGDGSYIELAQVNNAVRAGDHLYLHVYTDAGSRIYALPMEGGAGAFLALEHVSAIAAREDGQILIETFDYGEQRCEFWIWDDVAQSLTAACDPLHREQPVYGIACSGESGRLFYLEDGFVMAASDFNFEGAEAVAQMFIRYADESAGMMLPGDYYVCCGYSDGVGIRSTAPGALPQTRITVQSTAVDSTMMNAYYKFSAEHGDVAVVLREKYADDGPIAQDMMNRDSSVDVYMMSVSSEAYDALYSRGYLAALNDPAIVAAVGEMYPAVQDAITRNGEVVAVPVMAYGWTLGLDYEGFEKIGVPREKMPTDWNGFLDLLTEIPDLLPEDGSVRVFEDYNSQQQVRRQLMSEILESWHLYLDARGEEAHYDSPELKAALDKVMALDMEALGLPDGGEDDGYGIVTVSGSGGFNREYILVNPSVGCSIGSFFQNVEPALLSVIPGGAQPVPLDLAVAFVNPYSPNFELAQAFLATILDSMEPSAAYNISDKLNEPVRSGYYARALRSGQEELARAQAGLEAANPADAPLWEERIAGIEGQLADIDAYGWLISEGDIEWYRGHEDQLAVNRYHGVDVLYGSGEFTDLARQLLDGRIDADAFLRELDHRVQMKAREGN